MLKTYSRSQSQRSKSASSSTSALPKEFVDSCRLCLTNKGSYEMFRSKIPLVTKEQIKFCTGIEVFEGDGLPAKLCQKCITYLLKFCAFKEKCVSNEGKLKQLGHPAGVIYQPAFPNKFLKDASDGLQRRNPQMQQRGKSEESHLLPSKNNEKGLLEEENISPDAPDDVISKVKKQPEKPNYNILNGVKDIPLICQECKAPFSRLIDLINHHTRDHGWNRPVQKSQSSQVLNEKKRRNHVGIIPPFDKTLYCDICSESFADKNSLQMHIKAHLDDKAYSCPKCIKTFSNQQSVLRHIETHENMKYQCKICSKICINREEIQQHMRTHPQQIKIRTYKCKYCDKSFCHSSGLSRHTLIHKGTFFKCSTCSKHFHDSSCLRRHIRKQHPSLNKELDKILNKNVKREL